MIAKRLLAIQKASSPPAPAATDVYYDYRSLILNMQGSAGSTTFTDSSPNNFTVTPYGNAQLASDATFGTVASFDGNGDYLQLSNNALYNFGSGNFTIEGWIYPVTSSGERVIVAKNEGSYTTGFEWWLGILGSNNLQFTFVNASATFYAVTSSTTIPANTWTHVSVVRSGSTITLFVNGVISGTTTSQTIRATASNVSVSRDLENLGGGRYFNGLIGPLRISPWAVYKSNFTPSQDLFPAAPDSIYANPYYDKVALSLKFDGTNGSTSFVDTGPNAFAVTPSGNAQITSASKYGSGAGAFDGNGDYLLAPGANGSFAVGTSPFTIEFWMLANDITSRQGLFSNNINSSSGLNSGPVFAIRGLSTTGKLGVGNVGQADKVQTPENVITVGSWHHIALVREGIGTNQTKIYVDGITQGTGTMSDNYNVARDAGVARTLYYSEYFNGSIDELEITPGVAKYKANFTPPVRGLSTIYNPYTTLPVSGAALWLDGADSSTLFTDAGVTPVNKSGDLVYQWSDKSGNNRHAVQTTSANRPTWLPPASGRNGLGAVAFNGTSQFLNLSSDPIGTNDFTIEFWMKQNATTNSYWVILDSRISGNALGYPVILYNNSSTTLAFYNNAWLMTATVPVSTWTHVAFTRSSGTLRMFVNGVQQATATDTSNYSTFRQLGKAFDPYYFNGQIQNFIIYNGQALYTSNFTPWMS